MGDKKNNRKQRGWSEHVWAVCFSVVLVAYTILTLLDAFVIPKDVVQVTMDSMPEATRSLEDLVNAANGRFGENEYTSDTMSVKIKEQTINQTQVYIADIHLVRPSSLRAGLAGDSFGRNVKETTSVIATRNQAIFAVNGDFYGFRDKGYVMRNGFMYREIAQNAGDNEDLVIDQDGTMSVVDEYSITAKELEAKGAQQIFSFGPGLVRDGKITVDASDEVEQSMQSNPRTAAGMIDKLHYIFLVSDGRTQESAGLSLRQLAKVMKEQGCQVAYNLDGGGSATMWFHGRVVNNPTTNGDRIEERRVSDIVYLGE